MDAFDSFLHLSVAAPVQAKRSQKLTQFLSIANVSIAPSSVDA